MDNISDPKVFIEYKIRQKYNLKGKINPIWSYKVNAEDFYIWIKEYINLYGNKLGYELRIGNSYNYFDTKESLAMPCKIINIFNDGNYIVYEFKYDNENSIGSTIYPNKLQPK